jgi:UDP-glucose 4-epimerase
MPLAPRSPYALEKVTGEAYSRLFTDLYGLETVATRYFNVFGPRQDPASPYSGVISLFIKALAEGRRPTVDGDGGQTRDFIYVGDVVDGVLKAAVAPGVAGEVMNLATGTHASVLDLVGHLQKIFGVDLAPVLGPPRLGDVRASQADIAKAKRLLGFQPGVSFADGLRRTVEWYRASAR